MPNIVRLCRDCPCNKRTSFLFLRRDLILSSIIAYGVMIATNVSDCNMTLPKLES